MTPVYASTIHSVPLGFERERVTNVYGEQAIVESNTPERFWMHVPTAHLMGQSFRDPSTGEFYGHMLNELPPGHPRV